MTQPRYRTIRRQPSTAFRPVLTCAVCGFRGVPAAQTPAARWGNPPITTTGTTYVGTRADDPVTSFDLQVTVVRQPGECPHCGAERYLDGRRGSGVRLPH
jgi:hypothetical protein